MRETSDRWQLRHVFVPRTNRLNFSFSVPLLIVSPFRSIRQVKTTNLIYQLTTIIRTHRLLLERRWLGIWRASNGVMIMNVQTRNRWGRVNQCPSPTAAQTTTHTHIQWVWMLHFVCKIRRWCVDETKEVRKMKLSLESITRALTHGHR